MDIAAPILAGHAGVVHVGMDRDLIRAAIWSAILRQTGLMCLVFLLCMAAAYVLVRRIARPLRKLAQYANQLATTDSFSDAARDCPPAALPSLGSGDEVSRLTAAFRHLIDAVVARERQLKEAEEAVRRREVHFRSLIENVSDVIVQIDPSLTVCYVSPSVERVLG
jgi:nitrogen fixation/metabolism regulation signal transduction histidine kinase